MTWRLRRMPRGSIFLYDAHAAADLPVQWVHGGGAGVHRGGEGTGAPSQPCSLPPTKQGSIALGKIMALSVISLLSGASSAIGTTLSLPKLMGAASEQLTVTYGVGIMPCWAW